jgi:hypothetical protein
MGEGHTLYVAIWDDTNKRLVLPIASAIISNLSFIIQFQNVPEGHWDVYYYYDESDGDQVCNMFDRAGRDAFFFNHDGGYVLNNNLTAASEVLCRPFPNQWN